MTAQDPLRGRVRPLAARTARGRLHVARRVRRGFETACHRTISLRAADAVYEGVDRDRAWRHELVCVDCESLKRRGWLELIRVAGW